MELLQTIDDVLGLQLLDSTPDISDDAKQLLVERRRARDDKNWARSDELRDQLKVMGIKQYYSAGAAFLSLLASLPSTGLSCLLSSRLALARSR